jgi:N-6 DNA Methylase
MVSLVRSKQRVADHGEVFTPPELVTAMLDLVRSESERIDSRILEPACGSGNFLVPVLQRKLRTARARYGTSEFEHRNHALLSLMSIYGIELLADNVEECRRNLLESIAADLGIAEGADWFNAATAVLAANIVHGDALAMVTATVPPTPITFAEWAYLGKGRFHRRDFRLDTMTQMSSFGEADTLFAELGKHEIFTPAKDHGSLSLADIAAGHRG